MPFRTERDPLGDMQVPADAYYGVQTARAVENFPISGLRAPADLIVATILVKKAAAGTSHNMNANEVLANRAAEILGEPRGRYARVHPNDHVNMGQSTNDVFPTATRLALLLGHAALAGAARDLAASFRGKAEAFAGVLKTGRTHLQDAVPITL